MKPDEPRLTDTGGGVTVVYRNRNLYSPADPIGSALKRVRRFLAGPHLERSLVLVPSLGLGYGLQELLDGLPRSSRVVCIEADQAPHVLLPVRHARPDQRGGLAVAGFVSGDDFPIDIKDFVIPPDEEWEEE